MFINPKGIEVLSRKEFLNLTENQKQNYKIQIYDEHYKHGGVEDIDLFYRAKLLGKKLIMTPNVHYWHKEGATRYSETQQVTQSKAIKENEEYFMWKWGFHPIKELYKKILLDNRINL